MNVNMDDNYKKISKKLDINFYDELRSTEGVGEGG